MLWKEIILSWVVPVFSQLWCKEAKKWLKFQTTNMLWPFDIHWVVPGVREPELSHPHLDGDERKKEANGHTSFNSSVQMFLFLMYAGLFAAAVPVGGWINWELHQCIEGSSECAVLYFDLGDNGKKKIWLGFSFHFSGPGRSLGLKISASFYEFV